MYHDFRKYVLLPSPELYEKFWTRPNSGVLRKPYFIDAVTEPIIGGVIDKIT